MSARTARVRGGARSALLAGLALVTTAAPTAAQAPSAAEPRTVAERSGYTATSRHADVLGFLEQVAASSPHIRLDTMGYSMEGRVLPLAVVSREGLRGAEGVRASGRVVVFIQGNIHAGEVEGKESAQILLRELAAGRHDAWLDSLVLLVLPIYNADGNERVSLTNRPLQHGPVAGMGQRANAQGLDLNRDYVKLDAPESVAAVRLLAAYDPHVAIDLHTTNGTRHGYHLTYAPPLHPNTDSALVRLLRESWLPAATAGVKRATGWDTFHYGDVDGEGERRGWYSFDHRPRFGTNYWGLRNRFGILSEAFSYASYEDRIRATSEFLRATLDYAHAHATRIRQLVAEADTRVLTGDSLALRATFERSPERHEILLGETEEQHHPQTGAPMLLRRDVQRPERMHRYDSFAPTLSGRVPAAYLVPVSARRALRKLEQHGVRTAPVARDTTLVLERFRVDSTFVAEREFQGHRERTVRGGWGRAARVALRAGEYVRVPMDQPLARLAFTLLEPASDDGLLTWNTFEGEAEVRPGEDWAVLRAP